MAIKLANYICGGLLCLDHRRRRGGSPPKRGETEKPPIGGDGVVYPQREGRGYSPRESGEQTYTGTRQPNRLPRWWGNAIANIVPIGSGGETFTISPIGGENAGARFDFAKVSIGRKSNGRKGLGKIVESDLTVFRRMVAEEEKQKKASCDNRYRRLDSGYDSTR